MASIMIVDDDNDIREYLELLLSNTQFDTFVAPGGGDTIAAMQTIRPDMLLVDIKMPGMDGYELIRRIRQMEKDIPIIAISGIGDPDAKERVMAAGGNGFIAKPFDEKELFDEIARYLPQGA